MVQRFAIKIAYDGENYRGFQRQIEGILTVEGEIITTLKKLKMFPKALMDRELLLFTIL